jgi:hypothetical protein
MLLLGLLVSGPRAGTAAEPDTLRIAGSISPSIVRIGERVRIRMAVPRPDSTARLLGPPAPMAFGPVDIVTSGAVPDVPDSLVWAMEIAFFEPGDQDVARIPFALETASGPVPVRLRPYRITVESTLPDTLSQAEIRDLKGPMAVPLRPDRGRILLAVAILAAVIAAALAWRRYLRRPVDTAAPIRPVIAPETRALLALRELEEEALPARGRFKDHYARLSLILREYLEGRYAIPAVESTTDEIRFRLGPLPEGARREELLHLLEEADLVKFARFQPTVEAGTGSLESGRRWVEATRSRTIREAAS